jgi:hypothetical protein
MRRPFPVKANVVAGCVASPGPPRFHSHSERATLGPVHCGVRWMSAAVCLRALLSQGSVRAVTLDTAC